MKMVYSHYASAFKKSEVKIIGDKNPQYSKRPSQLKKIFPEAKFVHIVRDYRDHIISMQRVKLLYGYLPLISHLWRKSQQQIFKFKKTYPGDIISLKYEDLATNPTRSLQNVCDFLEVEFNSEILNYHEQKDAITNTNQLKSSEILHGNLFKPISADNVNKWKSEMPERNIKGADFFVGKYAELSGYERQYLGKSLEAS